LQFLRQRTQFDFFSKPTLILLLLGLTLTAGLIFQLRHRRSTTDIQHWQNLTQARTRSGLSLYFACYFLLAANSYIVPILVQQALGFDVPSTGLLLSVSFFSGIVFATVYAQLQLRYQTAPLRLGMTTGCMMLAAYGFFMSRQSGVSNFWQIASILVLNGGFLSAFIISVAQGTFKDIEPDSFTHAYQIKNVVRQIALSSAISIRVLFLQERNALHYARLTEAFDQDNPNFNAAVNQLHQNLPLLNQSELLATLVRQLSQQTTLLSCLDYFQGVFWVGLALATWVMIQRKIQ